MTQDQTAPDDVVIRPSQAINYGHYLAAALQMVVCAMLFAILRRQWPTLSTVFLLIPLIAILGLATLTWLRTATTSYRFGGNRITWRTGALSREAQSLELDRVAEVSMRQTLSQRLFGVGQIVLRPADPDRPEIVLPGVPRPDRFRDWLADAVQETRRERGMRDRRISLDGLEQPLGDSEN